MVGPLITFKCGKHHWTIDDQGQTFLKAWNPVYKIILFVQSKYALIIVRNDSWLQSPKIGQ